MATYNNLPLYIMDLGDENTGVEIISLVDFPAIEKDFVKFSKNAEIKFKVNEDKHIVSGPALIPEKPIYRRNDDGFEYYVKFSADAIRRIAEKFFADRNTTNVNVEHEIDVDGCVYFESYFIDKERGIVPSEFSDLPNGTWILSCKINNPAVWQLVKDGTLRGFSIEGVLRVDEPKETVLDTLEDLFNYLKG